MSGDAVPTDDPSDGRERLVVVGFGMATVRLVEELARAGALGPGGRYRLTVIGDEPQPGYNRVMLSSVVAGTAAAEATTLRAREWYDDLGVRVLAGRRAVTLDPPNRCVEIDDGSAVPYDRLVLATGGAPVMPPIRGALTADRNLHPQVVAFRTLDDCARLLALAEPGRSAVVVGGGLLGLEAARGLAERGMLVDIVEMGEHLMSRQLDAEPGAVLRRAVTRIGIGVHTSVRAVALDVVAGAVRAVRLDDSFRLEADLVVLACGVRPRVSLARAAGLRVGDGILIDDRLGVLGYPELYAIGDCAEHRGRSPGAVGVAWEQAAVLAKVLLGDPVAAYTGSRQVTRLRAMDLDAATFGVPRSGTGDEVVEYVNPLRGIYRRLIVRDRRLIGGVLVGSLDGVGLLLQFYDQDIEVPAELEVLLGDIRPGAGPLRLPDDAIVCQCNRINAAVIRSSAYAGADSAAVVARRTRATTGCGGCAGAVELLLAEVLSVRNARSTGDPEPLGELVANGAHAAQNAL
ncbi:MAG TPA: FAD-dependent oxidoreductase [Sporichthyaceae bacterium]|jgi:NAD(P)H-nitrite reductase large subunit|nr:FAD-dependent oxidoreductase [Sporichthyaceae bacterium]